MPRVEGGGHEQPSDDVGTIDEAISRRRYWKESAIFVTEDDSQDGLDHVDGHRTVGLAISPYTRHGSVDSHFYTIVNMFRTIEQILGLPPTTQIRRRRPTR